MIGTLGQWSVVMDERVLKWYFLNGYWQDSAGQKTTDPGNHSFPQGAWKEYDPDTSFLLSDQFRSNEEALKKNEEDTQILDLSAFTNPPLQCACTRL